MKKFILSKFVIRSYEQLEPIYKLDDFELLSIDWNEDYSYQHTISERLNSACVSAIKLRDPFLAGKMRISYIPDNIS